MEIIVNLKKLLEMFSIMLIATSAASMQSKILDNKNSQERPRFAIPSPGTLTNSANVTVYLGYANNPFGPSIRFQHEKGKHNFSTTPTPLPHLLSYSSPRKTLEDWPENFIDTGQPPTQETRSKRGVIHLYNMVSCATGCNPLIYKGYGCYCGFLGSGYAVDGIDRCCKKHDWCYDSTNCPMFLEYFVPYYWTCYHNRPLCALDHGEWGGRGSCAQRLCECDRILSECLSRYPCPSSRALCRSSPIRLLQNALMIF